MTHFKPPTFRIRTRHLLAAAVVAVVAACGGGGGGGGGSGGGGGTPDVNQPLPPIAPLGEPRILVSHAPTMARLREMLAANAPPATRFKGMVDTQLEGADHYGFEPWFAALIGQITGSAHYCADYAVPRTDEFVKSEEELIAADQPALAAKNSYLYVGGLIGNVALVYDWCRAQMTEDQRARWRAYANQSVWNIWNPSQARWGNASHPWTGWSVDNPSNNYYYSFLEATMLLGLATQGENDMAPQWLNTFRTAKIANQLVPTFNTELVGGGSREGTGYGVAMRNLWRLYDWWEKSTGERIADLTPHTLASIAAMIHSISPKLDRVAPTGDHSRDSSAMLHDYHRDYLQLLIHLFPNERLSRVARTLLAQSTVPVMSRREMLYSDYLYDHSGAQTESLFALNTAYWASGTGQFSVRSGWAQDAVYTNFICGPFTESHAHRDQGSFVLFHNQWLAYDANVHAHSGIEKAEAMHNLVRFEQADGSPIWQSSGLGCEMRALMNGQGFAYASARVTPVYGGQSQVVRSERELVFIKPNLLVVLDRVQSSGAGTRRVWTMNFPGTPGIVGDRITYVGPYSQVGVRRLSPTGLTTEAVLWKSVFPDFHSDQATRVDVVDNNGDSSLFLHVITVGAAASTGAARSDAQGQIGAQVPLEGGRTALVRFNLDGPGGLIEIRNSAGDLTDSIVLTAEVNVPPLFKPVGLVP